jgi:deoxyribonuclease-4
MFPLAAHTFGFVWHETAEATLEKIAQLGISRIQLMASPPHFDPWQNDKARTRRLRDIIRRHDLTVLAGDLSSADVNLASPSREARTFAIDAYTSLIERCTELDARFVCVGSGRANVIQDGANAHLLPLFQESFDILARKAKIHGLNVLLENQPHGLLAKAETIAAFLAGYSPGDVQCAYDVANAYAIGEDPAEWLPRLEHHLAVVHLSDSPRNTWRHDPVGTGTIDFVQVKEALVRIGYTGPVVLEIQSATPLESLRQSRDALVAKGWQFDRW